MGIISTFGENFISHRKDQEGCCFTGIYLVADKEDDYLEVNSGGEDFEDQRVKCELLFCVACALSLAFHAPCCFCSFSSITLTTCLHQFTFRSFKHAMEHYKNDVFIQHTILII